jgi:oligopeptide transport system substrate-binding protein
MKLLQKLPKIAVSVMICLIFTVSFSACRNESDGTGADFALVLPDNPGNLDPQLSTDSASREILMGTFRGLLREDENGAISVDAAESFTMSDDGKVYTFTLRNGIKWYSKSGFTADLTAEDFVYAFRRIYDSDTHSPFKPLFICIKNAGLFAGMNAADATDVDIEKLGVKAINSTTVEFTLEYPNVNFTKLLSLPAAFPCNEEFFKSTKGRYGLSTETSVSNGAFYVADWNYDPYWHENFIEIYENELNFNTDYIINPHSVLYHITPDTDLSALLRAGDINGYKLGTYDRKQLTAGGISFKTAQTKAYVITANPAANIADNRLMRALSAYAQSYEFDEEKLIDAEDRKALTRAYGIIPGAVSVMGKRYRGMVADKALFSTGDTAPEKLWNSAAADYPDGLGDVRLLVSERFPEPDFIYEFTDSCRKLFGVNILVEVVSENEYELRQADTDYDMILTEITARENSPGSFLSFFTDFQNIGSMVNANNSSADTAASLSEAIDAYERTEKAIISSGSCIPLFYGYEYYIYDENASDIEYIPFTGDVILRKAKMY